MRYEYTTISRPEECDASLLDRDSLRIMQLANQAAQEFNHRYTATHHLLYGFACRPSTVPHAALMSLGVDREKLREAILLHDPICDYVMMFSIPRTESFWRAFQYSLANKPLGSDLINPALLFAGLIHNREAIINDVLKILGTSPAILLDAVENAG